MPKILQSDVHKISPQVQIPASIAATCFAFPAIITRLESYLIAQDACESLQLKVELAYALEALTKDSDNTEEHRGKQVHFQRGMGKNYERLEFLGDSFLKMATSISLFAQNPHDQEFDYHVNRMCLICNRNLFNTAKERKIYEFIRSKGFSRCVNQTALPWHIRMFTLRFAQTQLVSTRTETAAG